MARKATTFRLDADAMNALADLSKILGVAMNQLVNDAVRTYLARRTGEVERDLQASLARLQEYRRRDPDFTHAIAAYVQAEAGEKDPVEGRLAEDSGPVRKRINHLLNA